MNKIIIADICSLNKNGRTSGHYFPVAQNYLKMFSNKCIVAGGPIYKSQFTKHLMQLPYDHIYNEKKWIAKWHEIINCKALFKQAKGNIIVMQSVAILTTFIALLFFYKKNNSKLFLIQYYDECINSFWKRLLYNLIKDKINGIICSSDDVGKKFNRPYIVVTDYIYTDDINTINKLPYEKRVYDYSLVGGIYKDKGQLEAIKHLANKGLKILIAGQVREEGILEELNKVAKEDPLIEMNIGYITDDEYHQYIRQSKYCILNYSGTYNERSSGVVLDILFNGTPVIGNACKALNLIKQNDLGFIYNGIDNFNPYKILNKELYTKYQKNIHHYLESQKKEISRLYNFLTL